MDDDGDDLEAFVTNTLSIPHGGQHTANAADQMSTVDSTVAPRRMRAAYCHRAFGPRESRMAPHSGTDITQTTGCPSVRSWEPGAA